MSALPSTTMTSDAGAAYPPQNSLQTALQHREAMDSLATVHLDGAADSGAAAAGAQDAHAPQSDGDAMRLRGGCISLDSCGIPCDCCIIPCTIS
ncbi:hypothetical protein JCM10449v2_001971 [Rhodotorula kratochvilovae]